MLKTNQCQWNFLGFLWETKNVNAMAMVMVTATATATANSTLHSINVINEILTVFPPIWNESNHANLFHNATNRERRFVIVYPIWMRI